MPEYTVTAWDIFLFLLLITAIVTVVWTTWFALYKRDQQIRSLEWQKQQLERTALATRHEPPDDPALPL